MNANDLRLWTNGLAKLDAGAVDKLTEAEREVLLYFGGPSILRRGEPVRLQAKSKRPDATSKPIPMTGRSDAP